MNQETLKSLLFYDSKTGVFTWRVKRGRVSKGDVAGTRQKHGYLSIQINQKQYYSHRLAWLYMYGYWPSLIDHINRDKADNRISNLREASYSQNGFNSNMWATNTSGVKGVYWNTTKNKWIAFIKWNNKGYNLGSFNTKQEAAKMRMYVEEELR